MKNLRDYLSESNKNYQYVIKFAQQPSDSQVDAIKSWLSKYDLRGAESPALIEDSHNDFIDISDKDVYCMNVVIGVPISQYMMLQDLKSAAKIPEKFIVVRSIDEPIEQYANYDSWSRKEDSDAAKAGMTSGPRLSTDREYTDAEQPLATDLFGNEYNKKLLSYLAGVSDSRPSMNVDPPAPLFSWIKMEDIAPGEPHQDTSDFNAHIDTPKPTTSGSDVPPVDQKFKTQSDAMADTALPVVKFYKDPSTGATKQVVKPVERK